MSPPLEIVSPNTPTIKAMWTGTSLTLGGDPNLKLTGSCKICNKPPNPEVSCRFTCSPCRLVHYCSLKCKKKDWKSHREQCQRIAQIMTDVHLKQDWTKYTTRLIDVEKCFMVTNVETNLIVEKVKLMLESLREIRAFHANRCWNKMRLHLAHELLELAKKYEARPLLDLALIEWNNAMRCDPDARNLAVMIVPFLLLRLNKDDECVMLVRYYSVWPMQGLFYHLLSEEECGFWLLCRTEEKFKDILKICNFKEETFDASFLTALCIVKLRIAAAYRARCHCFEVFKNTDRGKMLDRDCIDHVRKAFVGNEALAQQQEAHVDRYLDIIHINNETVLPALLQPGPLLAQPEPEVIYKGSPSEAWYIVKNSRHLLARIPGALQRIAGVVGSAQEYACDVSIRDITFRH